MKNLTKVIYDQHLIIQSNSPGEIAAWVKPIVTAFKQRHKKSFVTLCLVPCQYASGQEKAVGLRINGVDQVMSPLETIKFMLGRNTFISNSVTGHVLCLGGDPLYTRFLSWKTGFKASIYTEHQHHPGRFFEHIFFKRKLGDLMASRVQQYRFDRATALQTYNLPDHEYLLFFLGSRPQHFKAFSSLFLKTLPLVLNHCQNLTILIAISPTLPPLIVEEFKQRCKFERVFIVQGESLDFIGISKAMISLPGTNTAEATYMQCPMLTVAPLNRPDLLIVDGIVGLLAKLPVVGYLLMKVAIVLFKRSGKFVSLPNKIKNKAIVPELVDVLIPQTFAATIASFATNQQALDRIKQDLASCQIKSSPADDIISTIFKT